MLYTNFARVATLPLFFLLIRPRVYLVDSCPSFHRGALHTRRQFQSSITDLTDNCMLGRRLQWATNPQRNKVTVYRRFDKQVVGGDATDDFYQGVNSGHLWSWDGVSRGSSFLGFV
jgi:hypothetical protein